MYINVKKPLLLKSWYLLIVKKIKIIKVIILRICNGNRLLLLTAKTILIIYMNSKYKAATKISDNKYDNLFNLPSIPKNIAANFIFTPLYIQA